MKRDLRNIIPIAACLLASVAAVLFWASGLDISIAGFDAGYYFTAAQAVSEGQNPYISGDYLYPPFLAWILSPAVSGLKPVVLAAVYNTLNSIAFLALLAGGLVLAGVPTPPRRGWWLIPVLISTGLYSAPAATAIGLGNVSLILGALTVWAGILWLRGRYFPAALLVALASMIKIVPLVILAWLAGEAIGNRNWRRLAAAASGAGIAIAGILLPPFSAEFLTGAGGTSKWGIDIGGACVSIHVWMARIFQTPGINRPEIATLIFAAAAVAAFTAGAAARRQNAAGWLAAMLVADLASPKNCPHLFFGLAYPVVMAFSASMIAYPARTASTVFRTARYALAILMPLIAATSEYFYYRGDFIGEILLPQVPLLAAVAQSVFLVATSRPNLSATAKIPST